MLVREQARGTGRRGAGRGQRELAHDPRDGAGDARRVDRVGRGRSGEQRPRRAGRGARVEAEAPRGADEERDGGRREAPLRPEDGREEGERGVTIEGRREVFHGRAVSTTRAARAPPQAREIARAAASHAWPGRARGWPGQPPS